MKKITFLAVFLIAGFTSTAKGSGIDYSSGNYMLPHCKHLILLDYPYDVWDGTCGGIIEAFLFLGEATPDDVKICRSKGITVNQATRVVVNYMENHPQDLHQPFPGLALIALSKAWPCK